MRILEWLRRDPILGLVLFLPVAMVARWVQGEATGLVFLLAALAMPPFAAMMGRASESLVDLMGEGLGGFFHATFGNAAELIIALLALRAGHQDLVKASLVGSVVVNVLFIFGLAALVGGARHRKLDFNRTAANLGATMLVLAVIALVVPAAFHLAQSEAGHRHRDLTLSLVIAGTLMLTYLASRIFILKTHRELYTYVEGRGEEDGVGFMDFVRGPGDGWKPARPLICVAMGALGVVMTGHLVISAVVPAAEQFGMSETFVGAFVAAMVGNGAERFSVIHLAGKNRMDAVVQGTIGSSVQVVLFVTPILVFASYLVGPGPMDLEFGLLEVMAVVASAAIMTFIAQAGETHWINGVQLLAVYLILGIAFFLL